MKLSLTIEGSASVIAAVLAALPQDGGAAVSGNVPGLMPSPGQWPTTSPSVPAPADDTDDDGPADANAPAVDARGMPWDERIHSSNRKTKADGTWTIKRGADKELIAQIEAELRGAGATPAPIPMPQPVQMPPVAMAPPPMPTPQPMPQMAPVMPAPTPQPQPMPMPAAQPMPMPAPAPQPQVMATAHPMPTPEPPAPQPQPMPTPAPQPEPVAAAPTFQDFMAHLMQQMQARDANGVPLVHADYLASVTQRVSEAYQLPQPLDAITALEQRPDLIPYTISVITADGRW